MRIGIIARLLLLVGLVSPLVGCYFIGDDMIGLFDYTSTDYVNTGTLVCKSGEFAGIYSLELSDSFDQNHPWYTLRKTDGPGEYGYEAALVTFKETLSPYQYVADVIPYDNESGLLTDTHFVVFYQENADGTSFLFDPIDLSAATDAVANRFGVEAVSEDYFISLEGSMKDIFSFLKTYKYNSHDSSLTKCTYS